MVIWAVVKQKIKYCAIDVVSVDVVSIEGVFDSFQKAKDYALEHITQDEYLNGCSVGELEFRLFKKNKNEVIEDSISVYNKDKKLDYFLSIIPTYLQ